MVTVIELYENEEVVERAVNELERHKFGRDKVWIIDQSHVSETAAGGDQKTTASGSKANQLSDVLTRLGVKTDEARFYTEAIKRGGQVVIIQTSGERAGEARNILQRAKREQMGS